MAIRTANKRAQLQAQGDKRAEWGVSTVIIHKRNGACPKCLPFVGKIMIDDVWSGGALDGKSNVTGKSYPLLSSAIAAGLYHPNCKDGHSTYYEGISEPPDGKYTKAELQQAADRYRDEQRTSHARRQAEKYERLSRYSLDPDNQRMYQVREKQWGNVYFRTGDMTSEQYIESKRPLANFRATPADEVAGLLFTESEEWIKKLTSEEIKAIEKYAYNPGDEKPNRFFERLNAMLRGEREPEEKIMKYAEVISEAIRKNKLTHDIIVYRGVWTDVTAGVSVGSVFKWNQFTSTSVLPEAAFDKPFKLITQLSQLIFPNKA